MPTAFFVAVSVQIVCQLFKFIVYSIRDRKLSPKYLVTAGGMPSAHSAFVSSLTVYLGLSQGTQGPWFSVSLVFGLIVAYDAFRLRGHVQHHSQAINMLRENTGNTDIPQQSEMVGHSLLEVGMGMVIGSAYSALMWLIISSQTI